MATGTCASPSAEDWRELYLAALLEGDRDKIPSLFAAAERAIVLRARELFAAGDNIEEENGLDDALYALHALKSCLKTRAFAEAA